MMPFELKPSQGTLFRIPQDKKRERGPDYEGSLNIDGTTYRLAGWIKEGRNGKWVSLKAELPRSREQPALTTGIIGRAMKEIDDDIPL